MDLQRTPVDNTPLLVNLLRLIRDARSPNYKDHEKGPVTFHFGGLSMRDTGGYTQAEELWRRASARHKANADNSSDGSGAPFRGPMHLAVYLNDAPVEVWTLQDFRDPSTEHSVPRDYEQLEQLNTLVRVLFAHLRSQEIYGVVLQSCVTATDDAALTQTDLRDGRAAASPSSPLGREATASSIRGPQSPSNHVLLRLFQNGADDCPRIPVTAQKRYLWSSEDFVRVDAVMNKAWRYQAAPPLSAFPATAAAADPISGAAQERSSPIMTNSSRASRAQTVDSDAPSPSTSPEVLGSLAKSSLPTPHLAPIGTSPSSINRHSGVSPMRHISPLLMHQGKSSTPALLDFALPPPELSELFDGEPTRQSRSSPLGQRNPSMFTSVVGNPTGKSNTLASQVPTPAVPQGAAAVASAVGHLEDVMWLSDALHVRRMGTLVSGGKDGAVVSTSPFSTPLGTKRRLGSASGGGLTSSSPTQPQMGSLLATVPVGALSALDLDSQLGWSSEELEDFHLNVGALGDGQERDATLGNSTSDATTEQLMSLLGLCSSVKLHHVAPAPFGDLVIALNLEDPTT
ncbi:hypothetical protein ABB37_02932 [Leptomonas pyrrhocoris]|uniref:Uncharacterized protein n=1 Tax=Leptomonas pyrrhocoris TaxID=157538 RepID=A0A0M9G688_LEPPY|nr:hypothetical protein ABB37_02932 [Leptomonas pyrrhocoris]KPA83253.1 hypothetical protein ABB37_02932 [Leptomonas pyrrhocoris]|eukprot:XP_015661692.1 hypothetical protein ABB37_02932 [Leptomonas pyrrhocoris]